MPQLDGIRGLCILGVFYAHFVNDHVGLTIPLGTAGVRTFFVLSGFLITSILFSARAAIDAGGQSLGFTLRNFYARRGLRIIVLFYAWIAATSFLSPYLANRALADVLYASNFYDIFFDGGEGNQYWSLAIEEQFYLFWPLLILMVPHRSLRPTLAALIGIAVITRLGMVLAEQPYLVIKKFTPCCFDALGIGALMALVNRSDDRAKRLRHFGEINGWIGAALLTVALTALWTSGKNSVYSATIHLGLATAAAACITPAILGYRGIAGKILQNPLLMYLGRISYGLYLMHLFVALVASRILPPMPWPLIAAVNTLASIAVATASWYGFERPINGLKKHFPMKPKASSSVT